MVYVDAIHDRKTDTIKVVERVNGERVYKEYPANYVLYYEDPHGSYKTMWGKSCKQVRCNSLGYFRKEQNRLSDKIIHESDINPIFRCLEENYLKAETPILNIGFFDIEVDFDPLKGFASPWDPFSRITAISVFVTNLNKLITLVLKPELQKTDPYYLSWEDAEAITKKFDNCILCNNERDLLFYFLDIIDDCDCLSGWNSSGYDIPYIINRMERVIDKNSTTRMCLWNIKPKVKEYMKFKKVSKTYDLVGRVHLDYLELYQKHNQQQLHSYRLDFVGEIEIGENKIPYEGTLDSLYKKDFEKFIAYNRQDTALLHKIDKKRKFIELSNQVAHTNTVLLPTTKGSVALIEQGIINEAHSMGMCAPDRKRYKVDGEEDNSEEDDIAAVGAYVAFPKTGLHEQIGCCDINSLYPSTIRSLNMGPETLVGQIRSTRTDAFISDRIKNGYNKSDAWTGVFCLKEFDLVHEQSEEILVVDFEDRNTMEISGKQLYDFIYKEGNPYVLSANGTIFRTDVEAIIPKLLSRWYSERKIRQAKSKEFLDKRKKLEKILIETKDLLSVTDIEKLECDIKEFNIQEDFWDQRQLALKVLLNALYGSLLNESCRFFDKRIGQSVTLTGRIIVKHMNSKINELISGEYQIDGGAIIYSDTDSSSSSTKQHTNIGEITIEDMFEKSSIKWSVGDKEYSTDDKIKVLTYNPKIDKAIYKNFNYIYRHKVKKGKWKITDSIGNEIIVTEDHSCVVERNSILIEIKPRDIKENDILISVKI